MSVCYFEQNGPFGIAVRGQQTRCLQYKQQTVQVSHSPTDALTLDFRMHGTAMKKTVQGLLIYLLIVYLMMLSVAHNI
jgi:hypothetical protein